MATFLDVNRATYLRESVSPDRLNYLSAKYKNIRFILPPTIRYPITIFDQANAPGIAFKVYGDKGYWWVVCQYTGVLDPITSFTPGSVLNLPSLADINTFLNTQEDASSTTVTI